MQSPGTRLCDVELRRLPVSGHTAAAVRPWCAAPPASEPARGPGFPVRVAGYTPTMSLVKSPVWLPVWAPSNCRKAAGGLRRQPAAAVRVPGPRSGRAPAAAPAPGLPDGACARGGPAPSPWPPQRRRLAPGGRVPCPVGCRVGHFVPHLPTLRPQCWRRGPLLAQTAPPRLRAGSCGSALQGRPRWPAAAAAGAPRRPSPPTRLGSGSLSRRRATVRWFGTSRGRPSLRGCPHAQPPPSSACTATAPRAGGETEAPGSRTSEACGQRRTRSGRGTQLPAPGRGPGPLVVCTLEGLLSGRGWRRRRALSRSRV